MKSAEQLAGEIANTRGYTRDRVIRKLIAEHDREWRDDIGTVRDELARARAELLIAREHVEAADAREAARATLLDDIATVRRKLVDAREALQEAGKTHGEAKLCGVCQRPAAICDTGPLTPVSAASPYWCGGRVARRAWAETAL